MSYGQGHVCPKCHERNLRTQVTIAATNSIRVQRLLCRACGTASMGVAFVLDGTEGTPNTAWTLAKEIRAGTFDIKIARLEADLEDL